VVCPFPSNYTPRRSSLPPAPPRNHETSGVQKHIRQARIQSFESDPTSIVHEVVIVQLLTGEVSNFKNDLSLPIARAPSTCGDVTRLCHSLLASLLASLLPAGRKASRLLLQRCFDPSLVLGQNVYQVSPNGAFLITLQAPLLFPVLVKAESFLQLYLAPRIRLQYGH
jgi:hypothetical protein